MKKILLVLAVLIAAAVALLVWAQSPRSSLLPGARIDEKTTMSILRSEAMAFLVTRRTVTQVVVEHKENSLLGDWQGVLWATVRWHWGVDLSKITAKDIRIVEGVAYVHLGEVELLDFSIEPGSVGFMSKSTAIPKFIETFGGGDQRSLLEKKLKDRAMEFAKEKQLTPSRQEMIDELNRAVKIFSQAGGAEIRFE